MLITEREPTKVENCRGKRKETRGSTSKNQAYDFFVSQPGTSASRTKDGCENIANISLIQLLSENESTFQKLEKAVRAAKTIKIKMGSTGYLST